MFRAVLGSFLDLIYPPKCVFCKSLLEADRLCCPDCVERTSPENCPICYNNYTECSCKMDFDYAISPFVYTGKVKSAIVELKLNHPHRVVSVLSGEMVERYLQNPLDSSSVLVFPVPASKKSLESRGFNQAEILAVQCAKSLNFKLITDALMRTEDSLVQHSLSRSLRRANADNSYQPNVEKRFDGFSAILIDDVITTGATINACSRALKQLGFDKVVALSASST